MRGGVVWGVGVCVDGDRQQPTTPPSFPVSFRSGEGKGDATEQRAERTFREQTTVAINQVFAQKPPIAKLVVPLYQFDAVTLCQGQLIGASGSEVICKWCASDKLAHGN